jgi:hypothetical protein
MKKKEILRFLMHWGGSGAFFLVVLLSFLLGVRSLYARASVTNFQEIRGGVDSLVVDGNNVSAMGWAGVVNPNRMIVSLSLWSADTLIYDGHFEQFERPDVAKAKGRDDWLMSGWRINAVLPDNLKVDSDTIKVVVKLDNGAFGDLIIYKKPVPSLVDNFWDSISLDKKNGALFGATQLILLFLMLLAAIIFPAINLEQNSYASVLATCCRGGTWLYRIFFFTIALVGGKFLLMKFTGGDVNLFAIIVAVIASYSMVPSCCVNERYAVLQGDYKKCVCLVAGILLWLFWVYSQGVVLPAHDPIAVPTYASILHQNVSLVEYFSYDKSGGFFYPPGLSLLLSVAYIFLDHASILLLFKVLCVLAVGLMPFSWAWLAQRFFKIPLPLWVIALCFCIAGFTIERTLIYTLPFAGKNAQLFMLTIFPVFFVFLTENLRLNWLRSTGLGFLFYSIALIHYSTFHLAFALFMAVSVALFLHNRKQGLALAVRSFWVGVVGVGCFVVFSSEALHSSLNLTKHAYDFKGSLALLSAIFFGFNNGFLSVFNETNLQEVGTPFRGYFLIGCFLFSVIIRLKRSYNNDKAAQAVCLCSGAFFIAIGVAAIFGSGLIPVGLNIDMFRWLIFPAQIGVIACALLSAYILLKNTNWKIAIVLVIAFFVWPSWVFVTETMEVKNSISYSVITKSQIHGMQNTIVSGPSGCGILSPNAVEMEDIMYMQKQKILEYAEMVTGCRMLAGSWVHGPSKGWRERNGLPSDSAISSFPVEKNLYFVGKRSELDTYGGKASWEEIGFVQQGKDPLWGKVPVWKMKAPAK